MKKIFSILLLVAIIFAISACEKKDQSKFQAILITESLEGATATLSKTEGIAFANEVLLSVKLNDKYAWRTKPSAKATNATLKDKSDDGKDFNFVFTDFSDNSIITVTGTAEPKTEPVVEINSFSNITATTATCYGSIISDGDAPITARGICWSTNHAPTVSDSKTSSGSGLGSFVGSITDLKANTIYYVRAYATNEIGTGYSEERYFTTKDGFPSVSLGDISNITTNSAFCKNEVTSDGGASVTARGICWSTSSNPTISDNKTSDGSGVGVFSSFLTNLQLATLYYVRAYATNSFGTSYSEQKSFITNKLHNGHEYVDLGLSIMWATTNIGANSPEEYGNYYAWGETQPKSTYNWSTYKYGNYNSSSSPNYGMTKYNKTDNKTTLELADDAARANWGGNWRMPTWDEQKELLNNCTWTWTAKNGKNGYEVKSKTNGNTIFLPAAGFRNNSGLGYAGENGYYWSSSLYSGGPNIAYYLIFESDYHGWDDGSRCYGLSVRAVCSK